MTLWSPARADHFPPPAGGPDRREGAGWGPQSWPRVWPSHSHRSPASTEPTVQRHLHHLFPAPWPGGGQGSPQAARVDRALWAKPQSPQPLQGEWIRAPKLPRGGGWHHPDISGMQTGGDRAQHRRQTKPGLLTTKSARLCSHPHLVPEMSPRAPGKHSCTVHCRDKPDGKHTHTGRGGEVYSLDLLTRLFTPDKACVLHGPPLSSGHGNNQEAHCPHVTLERVVPKCSSVPAVLGAAGGDAPGTLRHQPTRGNRAAPRHHRKPTSLQEADAASTRWFLEMVAAPGTPLLKKCWKRELVNQNTEAHAAGSVAPAKRIPHAQILRFPSRRPRALLPSTLGGTWGRNDGPILQVSQLRPRHKASGPRSPVFPGPVFPHHLQEGTWKARGSQEVRTSSFCKQSYRGHHLSGVGPRLVWSWQAPGIISLQPHNPPVEEEAVSPQETPRQQETCQSHTPGNNGPQVPASTWLPPTPPAGDCHWSIPAYDPTLQVHQPPRPSAAGSGAENTPVPFYRQRS